MSISIENITKKFGNFVALKDITFEIKTGELVALLGPSGSGKTTLLRVISGLEMPESGRVLVHGDPIMDQKHSERQVGFVFQHYALFRHMNVFENVAFGLKVRPRKERPSDKEIQSKVQQLLELVRLDGMSHRYPSQLSGGQRQRVALARALAIEPRMLLLDEPFGALDAKVRKELRQWLRDLHDKLHMTSVFVTHDQEEALEVADRIVVMNEGRIEQIGTPDEVYHQPVNPFVYDFLGNVNLFHCRFEGEKAYIGNTPLEGMGGSLKNGKAYIRPHLFEIDRDAPEKRGYFKAQVKYINAAGPIVKVELKTQAGDLIQVELPHERYNSLQLKKEDDVFVSPKELKVFNEDYSI
jgi:sulfate/thiosulfate transport system ATP-binding protein